MGVCLTTSVLQTAATNLVQNFAEAKIFYHDLDQKECWDLFLILHCCLPLNWGNLHNSGGRLPSERGQEGTTPRRWRVGTVRRSDVPGL